MYLLQKFIESINREKLFQPKDTLLLAVSGGVDSVVLCELCKRAGFDFVIAHCNFQLRGEESEKDETFVSKLAKGYDVNLAVKKFETQKYAAENKVSIQVAARELRYEWFSRLINKNEQGSQSSAGTQLPTPDWIVTAHHANDNVETLLMNFFKGTGIQGLRGILPRKGKVVRPLLSVKKEELLEFARENGLTWVEDTSNASDKYTRNYFRNQLIPSLQKVFPQVEDNLINGIDRYREIELLYNQSIDVHKKKLVEQKGKEVHIPVLKLLKSAPLPTILYEIIREYGFTAGQVDEVIKLLHSDSGKFILSVSHRILKNRKWLIISPIDTVVATNIPVEEGDRNISFSNGKLTFEKFPAAGDPLANDSSIAFLDADQIQFPLLLRKWKTGDYFYPLGMAKKKKVSRFFIDRKLSLGEKENVWVLEMDKKILWVIGQRIDDRFKVTTRTENILKVSVS